jgi:hypothetical protein
MLEKRPMAAAPNDCTTSSVSTIESRLTLGASSTPERQTKTEPTTQAARRTAIGDVPVIASNVGSSTTPRMARPSRDRLKNTVRASVASRATTIGTTWS